MGKEIKNYIAVSVIIVNYKRNDLLKNCLNSLYQFSTNFSFEVIVVDNESDDDSIVEVTSKFTNLILLRNKKNLGFAKANNQGVKISNGKYLLFLNNDTVFIENTILNVIDYVKTHEDKQLITSCRLLNKDMSTQNSIYELPTLQNIISSNLFLYILFRRSKKMNKYHFEYQQQSKPISTGVVIGAFLFINKSLFENLGEFDERFYFYAEEMDLCKRLIDRGGEVFYLPQFKIIHLGGATTDNVKWFKYKNQTIAYLQYYQKHFNGIRFSLIIFIHYFGLLIRIPIYVILGLATFRKYFFITGFYHIRQLFVYPKNQFRTTV